MQSTAPVWLIEANARREWGGGRGRTRRDSATDAPTIIGGRKDEVYEFLCSRRPACPSAGPTAAGTIHPRRPLARSSRRIAVTDLLMPYVQCDILPSLLVSSMIFSCLLSVMPLPAHISLRARALRLYDYCI
uniref:Uncharacterized protein n=1 Tax=Plectus sambesii TaxID=2011161 RepID=A0A914VPU6_9BILA